MVKVNYQTWLGRLSHDVKDVKDVKLGYQFTDVILETSQRDGKRWSVREFRSDQQFPKMEVCQHYSSNCI
jgi:hypothetical protein